MVFQQPDQLACGFVVQLCEGLDGQSGDVLGQRHVRLARSVDPRPDWRLGCPDVQRRIGDVSGFERVGQGILVHDAAPRDVDDEDALLRLREEVAPDDAARGVGQRRARDDDVGPGGQLIERDQLDVRVARALDVRVVGKEGRSEATELARDDGGRSGRGR